jgi:hypothetical protein
MIITLVLSLFAFITVAAQNQRMLNVYIVLQIGVAIIYSAVIAWSIVNLINFELVHWIGSESYFELHWSKIIRKIDLQEFGKFSEDPICVDGKY